MGPRMLVHDATIGDATACQRRPDYAASDRSASRVAPEEDAACHAWTVELARSGSFACQRCFLVSFATALLVPSLSYRS